MKAVPKSSYGLIVLAAGRSTRMGSPKPALRLGNKTLFEHITENPFLHNSCIHPVAVFGHQSAIIREQIDVRIPWVDNPSFEKGRMTSIQCGLAALPDEIQAAFIWPADCPLVPASVLESLTAAFDCSQTICIPSYAMHRGHPPLIGSFYFPEIQSMTEDQSLRTLYAKYSVNVRHVNVESSAVLHNVNTPEQFKDLREYYHSRSLMED